MSPLVEKIDKLLEGEELDEVIKTLAFAYADSVAFATEYKYSKTNAEMLKDMAESAYAHLCSENSVTVN